MLMDSKINLLILDEPTNHLDIQSREWIEEAVEEFFQLVRQSLTLEGNYLILLVYDRYDVPYRAKDGERQEDAAAEVYSYLLCSICPVKQTKPALSYHVRENEFHNRLAGVPAGAGLPLSRL